MAIWVMLPALPTGHHVSHICYNTKSTQEQGVQFKVYLLAWDSPHTSVAHCWKSLSQLIKDNFIARQFVTLTLQQTEQPRGNSGYLQLF